MAETNRKQRRVRVVRENRRASQTALQDRAGGLPKRAFWRLVETGLLNQRSDDGKWDVDELERLDTVMELGSRARDLYRRVLLLSWTRFPVAPDLRHQALIELLSTELRPAPARKMREVRRQLDVLHRRVMTGMGWRPQRAPRSYGLPVPRERWADIVRAADADTFRNEYQVAAHYAQILPAVLQAEGDKSRVQIPDEEVLAMILINLLLRHPRPREAAGLPPLLVRRGLDIEE